MIKLNKVGRWFQFEEPIDPKLEKVIDKTLSYTKKGSEFLPNPQWGIVRLYNSKKRVFPCGLINLVLPILTSWQNQYGTQIRIDDKSVIMPLKVDLSELRPYQKIAFEKFWRYNGGLISLPTGAGKTRLAERIIASFPERDILVICPTRELVTQWNNELAGHKEIKEVNVSTYQSLYRRLEEDKEFLKKYKLVIFDECHHCAADTLYKVGMACPNALMLGLTATERRTDGADMKIQAVLGPLIYKVPIQELVDEGYIVQGEVRLMDIPKVDISPEDNYADIYRKGIVNNTDRNRIIYQIALKECGKGTVIIICKQIEHAKIINDTLQTLGLKIAHVTGESSDRDKTFQDILNGHYELIVCTGIYKEGVSIPRLKTMILASGGKSSTDIIQTTGRMLRLFPEKEKAIIYDFKDKGKILSKHYKERLNIYKENGFIIPENYLIGDK